MSVVGSVKQQPNDVQDYDIDFGDWFPSDDVIVSAVVSAAPSMPTSPTYSISPNGRTVKVWVYSGGVSGTKYQVTVRAATNDGRVKEVELRVTVKET